jgi:hypothetical protein
VETFVRSKNFIKQLKAYNGSACDGSSCGGSTTLDGTNVTIFLPRFLFGFRATGGGASES